MATAAIGHNAPPDPFTAFSLHVDDLDEQAKQFLDGTPIANEAQAEDVSRILGMLRKAGNDAEDARKQEKKPHDDAAKAVQGKWKPLLDRIDLAESVAKQALTPWLAKLDADKRAAAEAAAQEARRLADAAAQTQALPDDLAGQTVQRVRNEAAAAALKRATRLARAPVQARGGERAVSLRTTWRPEITDAIAFGKWAWEHRREEYLEFLGTIAKREASQGPRGIPGLVVHEDKTAV